MKPNMTVNRVLPQRSWAGAIPTLLTHDALDILCTPVNFIETNSEGAGNGNNMAQTSEYPCRPLERFLGCSYLRRQLHRIVTSEDHVCIFLFEGCLVSVFEWEIFIVLFSFSSNH